METYYSEVIILTFYNFIEIYSVAIQ